jgi:hypothetical protein
LAPANTNITLAASTRDIHRPVKTKATILQANRLIFFLSNHFVFRGYVTATPVCTQDRKPSFQRTERAEW